jgi:hypothetical protein
MQTFAALKNENSQDGAMLLHDLGMYEDMGCVL